MRVLIAPDKFKDALTAPEACEAIAEGLRAARPDWSLDLCPLTDGGEGFSRILTGAAGGEWRACVVAGPRGAYVDAGFGLVEVGALPEAARARLAGVRGGKLAIIEMAAASGLALLPEAERDVWRTDTRGTGELIAATTRAGADGILLGVGGSATNDLGLGALVALGAEFKDAGGELVSGGACAPAGWGAVRRVGLGGLMKTPPLWIACDVVNPLLGPSGAAAVYGRQKGLAAADLPRMDAEVARMAALLAVSDNWERLANTPGAGAAGGIAFGLMAACGARLVSGFDLVADWLALERRIEAADLVITGEGRFDASSLQGKGAGSLVCAARAKGKPVRVFAGRVDAPDGDGLRLHEITPRDALMPQALANAATYLRKSAAAAIGRAATE